MLYLWKVIFSKLKPQKIFRFSKLENYQSSKEEEIYSYETCGKRFLSSSTHVTWRTVRKTSSCEACGRMFVEPAVYEKHESYSRGFLYEIFKILLFLRIGTLENNYLTSKEKAETFQYLFKARCCIYNLRVHKTFLSL